ncbi:collagen alpha-2(I) chain-like [Eschrichtius robustus]|uniref:collagen alpha-2(I) chain-like n=1 Tax=Eschrichtius robustus TaxID=9764 RepID=UPI0035C24E45
MRNRGEVAGGVGGRRRREAAAGREGKGGGRRGAEAASRGELGLAEAAGAGPSASLPPGAPGMSAPGVRGRPLPALGRRTPAPLGLRRSPERLKLGSGDAQPIREGGTGRLGRAPGPLFPPSPKSAPAGQAGPLAQEAWVVGRGKASAKWGGQSGIVLPHPIAPRSKDPSTSPGLARPPCQAGTVAPARTQRHLLPQAPSPHARPGSVESAVLRETGPEGAVPASSLGGPRSPPGGLVGGGGPGPASCPRGVAGRKGWRGLGFGITPGTGRGASASGAVLGPAHAAVRRVEGDDCELVGTPGRNKFLWWEAAEKAETEGS